MKIETKFNIGDKVWWVRNSEDEDGIVSGVVDKVIIDDKGFTYRLTNSKLNKITDFCGNADEKELFATIQEAGEAFLKLED